jgi:hypothetical protein
MADCTRKKTPHTEKLVLTVKKRFFTKGNEKALRDYFTRCINLWFLDIETEFKSNVKVVKDKNEI